MKITNPRKKKLGLAVQPEGSPTPGRNSLGHNPCSSNVTPGRTWARPPGCYSLPPTRRATDKHARMMLLVESRVHLYKFVTEFTKLESSFFLIMD